jgi:molybdenum cofactor biosynthesis protein B
VSAAHVITVSDGAFQKQRDDNSGPGLVAILKSGDFEVSGPEVVPDEVERITEAIMTAVARSVDLIVTTGGTGLGPRDVTPQATAALLDYAVPGLGEQMRRAGSQSTPMAALSRSMAGVRERTLILNVPGSPKGAAESLQAVMPVLGHAVQLLRGHTQHI